MEHNETISYFTYESTMARMERGNKRLYVIIIILIAALILSNAGWILYESQFETVETSTQIEAEQDGGINIVGGGDISYGAESQSNNTDTHPNP